MTRSSNWIPVFTGMTWQVDSGHDSNAGQAFHRNDESLPRTCYGVGIYTVMTGEMAMMRYSK